MNIKEVAEGEIIQCISLSSTDDHPRTRVGDRFVVDRIEHDRTLIKGHRVSDGTPLVIMGDTGARHFRILQ